MILAGPHAKRCSLHSALFAVIESALQKEIERDGYTVVAGGTWVVFSCLD